MKKSLSLILSIILLLSFVFMATASGKKEASITKLPGVALFDDADNNVGKYYVEIKDARLTESIFGKPAIIVTYSFTNNSSEAESFFFAVEKNVFQNGIALGKAAHMADGEDYGDKDTADVQPGATVDIEIGYELYDTESDVVVEVTEKSHFKNDKITKTFSIK